MFWSWQDDNIIHEKQDPHAIKRGAMQAGPSIPPEQFPPPIQTGKLRAEDDLRAIDSTMAEIRGSLGNVAHDVNNLLKCTSKILDWMNRNEEHMRPLVELVVKSVYELMNCQRVTLYFVDHSKKELWIALAKDAAVQGLRIPLGRGIAGRVALTGEPVMSNNCYNSNFFDSSIDSGTGFHTQNMICTPIFTRRNTKVTAVLSAINKFHQCEVPASPSPNETNKIVSFHTSDLHVLSTFGLQVRHENSPFYYFYNCW